MKNIYHEIAELKKKRDRIYEDSGVPRNLYAQQAIDDLNKEILKANKQEEIK